jgi:Na+/proline symporter
MAEELISFKGKLIYEISKEAYIKIRKRDLINLYFNLILFTIVLLLALYLLYKFSTSIELLAISILIIIVICFAPLLIGSTLGRYFKTARLKKFRIYEKGFEPPIRPKGDITTKDELFIPFDDIKNVELGSLGLGFFLKLSNNEEIYVDSQWDLDGYMQLFKIIAKRFPEKSFPNIEVVARYCKAHQKLINKEITKNEFQPYLDELMEMSKRIDKG